jgi:EAL domain-containing protein (putative c-di-GMP-specific phosphodiesterase class I)/CHASE2 domain-containing sensor protein
LTLRRIIVDRSLKAIVLALIVGLFFGLADAGEPLENAMQVARNKIRSHPASESIVLVAIDDRSVGEFGPAPWNGAQLASLLRRVDAAGARTIHVDLELRRTGNGAQQSALETAIAGAHARILLPTRFSANSVTGARVDEMPPRRFARHAQVVNTNLFVWWDDAVWKHPYAVSVGGRLVPSLASALARVDHLSGDLFPIDYGIDVRSIPSVSASDVLTDEFRPSDFAGKSVVIARTDSDVDHSRVPGFRPVPSILFHLIAAETLLEGTPTDLGWLAPLLVVALLATAILLIRSRWMATGLLGMTGIGLIAGPVLLESFQVRVHVVPALAVLLVAAVSRVSASIHRAYRLRGTTNLVTGMPNLQALRQSAANTGIVIAARIKNYAQITATLPPQDEKELVDQIVNRLAFVAGGATIYQADEGVFVWLAGAANEDSVTHQLEGLQALYRNPIVVASRLIDVSVTFGLDPEPSRPLAQRVSSALVAADSAAKEGKCWATFNPASVEDADWAISLLARLDHAIDNDELWVAYQPQYDGRTDELVGAEALVRWTHPEKGQIYPDQFIAAAEQGGRIERLTYFVLDKALGAATAINRSGRHFTVAVNLSVSLLSSGQLVATVGRLLRKHKLSPELLTLEVTETSTLGSAAEQIANLERLSAMGIQLSIDDYGTGFSTLEYLRRIPASEIKIDRSFISMLNKSQSDRIMVNSTIQLAHSLGRKVVAEGVENEEILQELKQMGCDIVQGYHVGRPAPLVDLLKRLSPEESEQAA